MARQPLSLRARAVTLLAQRDHSELELRRKLGRIARQAAHAAQVAQVAHAGQALADAQAAMDAQAAATAHASEAAPAHPTARKAATAQARGLGNFDGLHDAESLDDSDDSERPDIAQQVDDVLVWLRQQGYLDESRFVESRLHARTSRWGQRRIEQELAQHGLSLDAGQRSALAETEMDRACELLRRKFSGASAQDPAVEARQMRFLLGRGFQSDLARRAIRAHRASQASGADQ